MLKKIAPWAGMLGPALFTLSFTINGSFRPDYNPFQMYVSELSIGPQGWIQIVSFMFLGISIMLFIPGLKASFPIGRASRSAPVLFAIIAVCYFLSGPFVTDPMSMFDNQQTLHGTLHGIFGAIVFSLSAVCCFVLWRRFHTDERWKPLATLTFIAGIAMVVLILLMKIGQTQTSLLSNWEGVIQRCCLIIFYGWIFAISLKIKSMLM
jgi:predicted transporter